jgi:hypothetical protein
MNSSFHNADRMTHFRVLLVALIAAVIVIVAGMSSQVDGNGGAQPGEKLIVGPSVVPTEDQRQEFMPAAIDGPREIV